MIIEKPIPSKSQRISNALGLEVVLMFFNQIFVFYFTFIKEKNKHVTCINNTWFDDQISENE